MASEAARGERGMWRIALVTVPAILFGGWLVGVLVDGGNGNAWYDQLTKPSFEPAGWVFGAVWSALYTLMGVALAMILAMPRSPERARAVGLFAAQMLLNFSWTPVFFGARMIDIGLLVILAMLVLVVLTMLAFRRLRPLAAALLLPYLAWLCLATALNFETGRLNPGADAAPLGVTGA